MESIIALFVFILSSSSSPVLVVDQHNYDGLNMGWIKPLAVREIREDARKIAAAMPSQEFSCIDYASQKIRDLEFYTYTWNVGELGFVLASTQQIENVDLLSLRSTINADVKKSLRDARIDISQLSSDLNLKLKNIYPKAAPAAIKDNLKMTQEAVEEVKIKALKSMDSLLERGRRLNETEEQSEQLMRSSEHFKKKAEQLNRCCIIL